MTQASAMRASSICLALLLAATPLSARAQAAIPDTGTDLNALPAHPNATTPKSTSAQRRARRGRPAPAASPPSTAADIAALRRGEAIVHGATSATQAPTTNTGYTGGPEIKGDILKSGPTGPQ